MLKKFKILTLLYLSDENSRKEKIILNLHLLKFHKRKRMKNPFFKSWRKLKRIQRRKLWKENNFNKAPIYIIKIRLEFSQLKNYVF